MCAGRLAAAQRRAERIADLSEHYFKYDTSEEMGKLFDLEAEGYFYTRLQNPTNDSVAAKICAMEGGVAAMLTSSGQAANFFAVFNICEAGDHLIASSSIYGGTYNLFGTTLKKMGIECTFVDQDLPEEELAKLFKPNTKVVFGETITNPTVSVLILKICKTCTFTRCSAYCRQHICHSRKLPSV